MNQARRKTANASSVSRALRAAGFPKAGPNTFFGARDGGYLVTWGNTARNVVVVSDPSLRGHDPQCDVTYTAYADALREAGFRADVVRGRAGRAYGVIVKNWDLPE
jgi:hypothetical protein